MITCPRCGNENAESARFCSACGSPLQAVPASPSEVRKTVTILFCDVVGSTSLGERTDPELLRRVMTRYFGEIRTVIERHGGIVEKFIGDAVMAVFGVPTVHEDDALRALRAAVEMRRRLAELDRRLETERGITVSWRTGINTGLVVAGDAGAGQRFVTGDAVNVAARLERSAQPGEILVGGETVRLVRGAAHVERIEPLEAKGKAAPVEVYRLIDLGPHSQLRGHRLTAPMIGRQQPSRLLADAYEQAVAERVCHLVTVLGAAGVGKSRLVSEFLETVGHRALVLRGRCLNYGDGITYWPVAEMVRSAAGLSDADDDALTRSKIAELIEHPTDRGQVTQRLGELIGRFEGSCTLEESFWAVRTLVESLARRQPLILVVEDLHWAEPTLLDLVDHLADWIREEPVLLTCLARAELVESRPDWGGGKLHTTTLTLEPLSEPESRELVAELLGRASLGGPLEQKIAAAAEGNPLFVEEMLGMLIDSGQLVQHETGWRAAADLGGVAVPPTIQALLAARLDGLPPDERAVLERAAVEGKVFHQAVVAELAPERLREAVPLHLRSLARKDLVRSERLDRAGDEAFRFRHLLVRDAVYAAMPKETRAELHARYAASLERSATERLSEYEEILGYHYEQAFHLRAELGPADDEARRLGRLGAEHLGASGERALDRGDVVAARKLLSSAAELVPADDPLRTRLSAELGLALAISGELQAADSQLAETIELARAAGDERGRAYAEVIRLETLASLGGATVQQVIDSAQELLSALEQHHDRRGVDRATFELARHQFFAGRAKLAEQILLGGIARYEPAASSPPLFLRWLPMFLLWGPTAVDEATRRVSAMLSAPINRDTEAVALQCLGLLRALVGEFDEGRTLIRRGIAIREELGHQVMALVSTGSFLGSLEVLAEDFKEAEQVLRSAYEGLSRKGERGFSATIAGLLGGVYVVLGRLDDAGHYAALARELAPADDVDAQPRGLRAGARVLAARGDFVAAQQLAQQAIDVVEQTDYLPLRGETYADLAEVLLAAGRTGDAARALRHALGNFEAKGATAEVRRMQRRLAELGAATV